MSFRSDLWPRPLPCTAGLISGLIQPLSSNCSQFRSFRATRTRDLSLETAAGSVPFGSGGNYQLPVWQPQTPFGQPQTAGVASHLIQVCGPRHSLQLHQALQRSAAAASRTPPRLRGQFSVYRPYRASFKEKYNFEIQ
jgi:hypothetical protein